MTCPLCGAHTLALTMFGHLFVAPCPTVTPGTMRVLPGARPLVLESSSRNQ